MKMARWQNQSH